MNCYHNPMNCYHNQKNTKNLFKMKSFIETEFAKKYGINTICEVYLFCEQYMKEGPDFLSSHRRGTNNTEYYFEGQKRGRKSFKKLFYTYDNICLSHFSSFKLWLFLFLIFKFSPWFFVKVWQERTFASFVMLRI